AKRVEPWVDPSTKVWGLRVPGSVADFLILDALRSTGGTAISVEEEAIASMQSRAARSCGLLIGPEGAAALLGLEKLLDQGWVEDNEPVVVFQTGHPSNYASGS
ncbi:MAG: pyridoxal-phosphate dependent enzyme, partial [Acidobacteriota bacterium]